MEKQLHDKAIDLREKPRTECPRRPGYENTASRVVTGVGMALLTAFLYRMARRWLP